MPKGPKGEKRPADTNACAVHVAKIATGEHEDDRYRSPGRKKSGQAGAKARAEKLTAEKRLDVARSAAKARWSKDMQENGTEKLLSLLFNEGRELVDIKFCLGDGANLTRGAVCGEAARVISAAFAAGLEDNPPMCRGKKTSISEAFSAT